MLKTQYHYSFDTWFQSTYSISICYEHLLPRRWLWIMLLTHYSLTREQHQEL